MKNWSATVAGAMLALTAAFPAAAQGAGAERVLVQVSDASLRAEVKAEWGVRHDFGDLGFSTDIPAAALPGLAHRPGVSVRAVPEATVAAAANGKKPGSGGRTTLPASPVPWGVAATYNEPGLGATSGGVGLVVAILDTGVAGHFDLAAPAQCKDFSQSRQPLIEGTCRDGNGHGTHVTGTIVADGGSDGRGIWGMAPQAMYYAYKVLNDRGKGGYDDIAAAIRMAADQGAHIINLSLGGSVDDPLLHDAVIHAASRGVLVVAAVGNSGPGLDTIAYPAAYPEVVAVGALLSDGVVIGVPQYSSRGIGVWGTNPTIEDREIEVAAPGSGVESTAPGGGYAVMSGTSMAAPHVTGLAALAWQGSAVQTRAWLMGRAEWADIVVGMDASTGYDPASGFGFPRLN